MKKKQFIFLSFLFVAGFIFSCRKTDEYKSLPSGLKYKILKHDVTGKDIKEGDILTLRLKYFNSDDSLLFNSDELPAKFRVKVGNSSEDGLFQDALKMLKTGDSASFKIPAKDFYLKTKKDSLPDFVSPDEMLRFEIKVMNIVSKKQLDKEYKIFLLKKEAEEKQMLREYIIAENIKEKPTASGIYIIKLKKGKGKKASPGKLVTLHYEGRFINGKIFDSSVKRAKPVTFMLGDTAVIPAWNEAIATMCEGDKIRLITGSENAYGKTGLKNYVPPFMSLIYDIKLLKVK